ncbi:hypothetical protein EON78_06785 [bacterium]|nr:MAG: hypothetical protein EON78_06785 [bacterium]
MKEYSMILTPHITTIEVNYTGDLPESGLLYTGMFNLGFLALKFDVHSGKMLDWWEKRLEDRCFQNKMESYFTDQKWMDFLPSFFNKELLVSFHLGMNLAPWNFYEREVFISNDKYYVRNRLTEQSGLNAVPLIFVHFSGYNYNSLIENQISQDNISSLRQYEDISLIMDQYSLALKTSSFLRFVKMPYSFSYFSNGIEVTKTYRRLYRRMTEDGNIIPRPFDSEGSFYKSLKESRVLNKNLTLADKKSVAKLHGVGRKLLIINRIFFYSFKILGSEKFFMLIRLMRIYSKVENHVYLINEAYLRTAKIRD